MREKERGREKEREREGGRDRGRLSERDRDREVPRNRRCDAERCVRYRQRVEGGGREGGREK